MRTHRLGRSSRWRVLAAAAIALAGVIASPSTGDAVTTPQPPAPASQTTRVIVQSEPAGLADVRREADRLGGRIVSAQQSLGTAVVDLPAPAVGRLRTADGVRTVTPDSRVTLQQTGIGLTGLPGDMANVAHLTGATTYWRNGFTGQGVDVALLDSGVLPVQGLTTTNKLVIGPDLSFESQVANLRNLDTFGHGTHMAGIIGGKDAGDSGFSGMAPGSRVVSLKLADAHGQTDVSQVIAAIDWVVTHAKDPGMNIRVLNLSFGTDSSQDYRLDPLAHAAEVAWNRGIVVVASAGNGDGTRSGLSNPAYDPAVLAVGAVNTRGTDTRGDDVVPAFSRRGNSGAGQRGPDLLAPGVSVVSLRAPGSFTDARFGALGAVGTRFFKGSGTSQSAAVVSGAAALLLSHRPWLSPDQVRDVLRRSARSLDGVSGDVQGGGQLDLAEAYSTNGRGVTAAAVHNGGGSLDAARGRFKVKKNGVTLTGEKDIFGNATETSQLAAQESDGEAWSGGTYNGATWAGGNWLGPVSGGAWWNGATWAGATWAGATWAGATWAGATWAGATWAGATWAGATWAGATWAGATWADAEWANDLWSSAGWE